MEPNTVRQVVYLERSSASILPLLPKKGGEGRGEEAVFHFSPLSSSIPARSSRGEREKNALSVFHAEHYRTAPRRPSRFMLICIQRASIRRICRGVRKPVPGR